MAGSPELPAGEQFLAILAHEICNAVGPIQSGMDLLQTEDIDEATSRWAQGLMRRQIGQLVWMVEGLRDTSRLRRGMIELHKEPTPLEDLAHAGIERAQPLIAGYEHRLIVDLADPKAVVQCDRQRMAQAVAHLLHNAARFSVRPGRIWVSTARDGPHAVVRVRDEGIGIEAEMLPRIFDLFMPAEPCPRPRQGGLGAGLTLVRGLVELHGGTVEARSQGTDQGSEFCIRLPLLPEGRGEEPAGADCRASPSGVHRVLIVEDNVPAAKILSALVALGHHEVQVAHSGEQALELAGSFHPDVVLLDLGLPGISGFDVAAELRARPEFAATRLVAVTGYDDDQQRRRTQAAGFAHYLSKPVTREALQEVLR